MHIMADQQQFYLLKQGAYTWNQWRKSHPDVRPILRGALLRGTDLRGANLSGAILHLADLTEADLRAADLTGANLVGANLSRANFTRANLTQTDLREATLRGTHFTHADLSDADLSGASLLRAELDGANFSRVTLGWTVFASLDLGTVTGLETVRHTGISHIDTHTIYLSGGSIPEVFLKRAGVPHAFLEVMPSPVNRPAKYAPCFISSAEQDQPFVERLYADLQRKGVPCWFTPHQTKSGNYICRNLDEMLRLYDRFLIVLSAHALSCSWLEQEVTAALEKERQTHKTVLFPLLLDQTVLTADGWPTAISEARSINDFAHWKEHDEYQKVFAHLLSDLHVPSSSLVPNPV